MGRVLAIVATAGLAAAVGLGAQQPSSSVAGKWDVMVDGQPARTLELKVEGAAVAGTLTSARNTTKVEVTGEFKKVELTFWTPAKEEFFGVVVREGEPVQGTYVHCVAGTCSKSGVTMTRPRKID